MPERFSPTGRRRKADAIYRTRRIFRTGSPIPNGTGVGLGPSYIPIIANNAIPPHGGALNAEDVQFSSAPDAGYIYQQVSVSAGQFDLSGWYISYSGGAEPNTWHHLQFGIDPTGGTEWNGASVVKGTDDQVRDGTWRQESPPVNVVVPSAGKITVFCYSGMDGNYGAWWAHAVDDVELLDVTPAVQGWELY